MAQNRRHSFLILFIIKLVYCYNRCDHDLTNADFNEGTFRITESGIYCFAENISFNPRSGNINSPNVNGAWFPTNDQSFPGSTTHADGGFALGFFSAISIETSNVELDLQQFELSMSKEFYIQQRFFQLIQIQNAPFNDGQGPADFGETISKITNIKIHNGMCHHHSNESVNSLKIGKLGRSSHNALHGFDVEDITICNLQIYGFEVAGIQLNGFKDAFIQNVDIGPSATNVPFFSYYSHGKFSLNGLNLIQQKQQKYVRFKGGRQLTLQRIYENLRESLDIAFRYELNQLTLSDKQSDLYSISMALYPNKRRLPTGSALYGMLFNSKGFAVQGFGDSNNLNDAHGSNLTIENVKIHDLRLYANEFPALYMDQCEGHFVNENGKKSISPILGRFGDVFDIRKALKYEDWDKIDYGNYAYENIRYEGNPLSDAQVALKIFSEPFTSNWGHAQQSTSPGKNSFIQWATQTDNGYEYLPSCAQFVCNTDAMFHLNKGIIGLRLDGIEEVKISDLSIVNLFNESPLGSRACGLYKGPSDGGQPAGLEREGYMGTDIRGLSIVDGGEAHISGQCNFHSFVSSFGDVLGMHLMNDAELWIDDGMDKHTNISFNGFECGAGIDLEIYKELMNKGDGIYPNNFYACNVKTEQLKNREWESYPYDYIKGVINHSGKGYIFPNGIVKSQCNV